MTGEEKLTMTILEKIVEMAKALDPEQQQKAIEYLDQLARERTRAKPRRSLKGICAGQGGSLSLEDFQELRREMWANFPRDIEP